MNPYGALFTISLLILLVFWPFLAVVMTHKLNPPSSTLNPGPQGGCSCTKRRCAEQAGEGNKGRS